MQSTCRAQAADSWSAATPKLRCLPVPLRLGTTVNAVIVIFE